MKSILILALCLTMSACAHGPKITGCVVDADNNEFACYSMITKKKFSFSLSEGRELICVAPHDIEKIIKGCKAKQIVRTPECSYNGESFSCKDTKGLDFDISVDHADNYFCVSLEDKDRMLERCKVVFR